MAISDPETTSRSTFTLLRRVGQEALRAAKYDKDEAKSLFAQRIREDDALRNAAAEYFIEHLSGYFVDRAVRDVRQENRSPLSFPSSQSPSSVADASSAALSQPSEQRVLPRLNGVKQRMKRALRDVFNENVAYLNVRLGDATREDLKIAIERSRIHVAGMNRNIRIYEYLQTRLQAEDQRVRDVWQEHEVEQAMVRIERETETTPS